MSTFRELPALKEVMRMENKKERPRYLRMDNIAGLVDVALTVISIIVTVINIRQSAKSNQKQNSNRPRRG